jgi:hypothetical protein
MATLKPPRNIRYFLLMGMVAMLLVSCSTGGSSRLTRIALIAPFEGRYREVGYNAYYAALLALNESDSRDTELVAIDDGGTPATAAQRAAALALDPLVKGVIILGYTASDTAVQAAYPNLPVLIIGNWASGVYADNVFILSSPQINDQLTAFPQVELTDAARLDSPVVGSDVFALEGYRALAPNWSSSTILSSSLAPEPDFRARYAQLGPFVPQPGLLATLSYDAIQMMLKASHTPNPVDYLATSTYEGINGPIRFEAGYWADAPIYTYRYEPECGAPGVEVCFIRVDTD